MSLLKTISTETASETAILHGLPSSAALLWPMTFSALFSSFQYGCQELKGLFSSVCSISLIASLSL